MLNGKYELITTTIVHEEIGSYIGYGIRYGEHTVTDISLDRAKIENLIERMNSDELSSSRQSRHSFLKFYLL